MLHKRKCKEKDDEYLDRYQRQADLTRFPKRESTQTYNAVHMQNKQIVRKFCFLFAYSKRKKISQKKKREKTKGNKSREGGKEVK